MRTECRAGETLFALLNHHDFTLRKFETSSEHVSGSLDHDFRQLLVGSGALRHKAHETEFRELLRHNPNRLERDRVDDAEDPPTQSYNSMTY